MGVILLYHAVAKSVVDPALQVSHRTILRHLEWLDRLGYAPAPLSVVLGESSRRVAAVTFDDGLSSIAPTVADLLARGVAPTLFVCPGLIGEENVWAGAGRIRERLLDLGELKRLGGVGSRFGVHGWDHRAFVGRPAAEVAGDLGRCQDWFAVSLQLRPEVFAWPFGRYDEAALVQVGSQYEHALGIAPEWGEDVRSLTIPRVVGCEDSTFDQFADEVELKAFLLDDNPGPLDARGSDRLK